MNKDKIQELQFLEQNVRSLIMQKQTFQMDLNENSEALKEVLKSKESVYKIIGQLMIKIDKNTIIKELENKEKLIKLRLTTLDKQEKDINIKLSEIKEELMKSKISK